MYIMSERETPSSKENEIKQGKKRSSSSTTSAKQLENNKKTRR